MSWFRLFLLSPILIGVISSTFKNRKKAFFTIYGIVTFLFFALRTRNMGSGDAQIYFNLWENLSRRPLVLDNVWRVFQFDMEKGFLLSAWMLSRVFHNGQFVFVFAAILFSYSLCTFFSENCSDYVLGTLMVSSIGLTSFFLQGLRQSLAISICLLSIKYCKERKLFKFLLTVGIASLFHTSALVFVPVYFIYGVHLNWKSIGFVCVLGIMGPVLLNRVTQLANFFMNESYVGGNTDKTSGGIITFVMYLCLILYCIMSRNEKHKCEKDPVSYTDYSFSFFLLLLCVVFFSMRFFYISVFERASYYFLPFVPVAVGATYSRYMKKSRKFVRLIFYAVFSMLALYKSGASSPLSAYDFFWNVT